MNSMRLRLPLAPALLALLLAACASPGTEAPSARPEVVAPETIDRPRDDPDALLLEARRSTPERAASLQLQAALLLEAMGESDRVAEIISALDVERLGATDRYRFTLLDAHMLLDEGRPRDALVALQDLPDWRYVSDLTRQDQRLAAGVRARAFAANARWLPSLRELIQLAALIDDAEQHAHRELIWSTLMRVDVPRQLAARPEVTDEFELRGWLELAAIATERYPTLEAQQQAVVLWRRRWEEHPAAEQLPPMLARLPELMVTRPLQVALLLPLSGPLSSAGTAIRDGFMAAHFMALAHGGVAPTVTVIDTASGDVTRRYLEAVDQGAELVIGPLAREAVRDLATFSPRDIPILALNATAGVDTDASLVQFGLLPEDEGKHIAERAYADGMRRALILNAQEGWAERLMATFEQRFVALGGTVVERRPFAATGQITENVAESLLIGESEARAREMRRVLAANVEFEPRRRQDLDFVMMAAEPVSARTLKPALAYHFAGDLPVYASSHMYDGSTDRRVTSDLDGIRFVDMPWRLLPSNLRSEVERAWPEAHGSAAPLYAMGVDAWHLQQRLPLLADGASSFPGMTGNLRLTANGRLLRELTWAVLHNGLPVPLESIAAPVTVGR